MTSTSPRSIDSLADLPSLYAAITASPDFVRAFGDPIPLSIITPGDEPGEHDMPEPVAAQAECGAVIATIFDLFAGTRLEPLAADIAWGFVNSFHFVAGKLERREDALTDDMRDLLRRPDLSEVYNSELEDKQLLCQSTTEQREAIECMRDYAAQMYRAQAGLPWSPARGSRASKAATASQVAAQDFLRARALESRERHSPKGPFVIVSGPAKWHDWQIVWERLDLIRKRIKTMVMVSTAQRTGFDAIAAAWAVENGVPHVAWTLQGRGRKAPFARNRQMVDLEPVEAVLGEGSGIQANLYQTLRDAGIPIHAFRKADQNPDEEAARLWVRLRRRAA